MSAADRNAPMSPDDWATRNMSPREEAAYYAAQKLDDLREMLREAREQAGPDAEDSPEVAALAQQVEDMRLDELRGQVADEADPDVRWHREQTAAKGVHPLLAFGAEVTRRSI